MVLLAIAGYLFLSAAFALGVIVGGIISIVNFYWMYLNLQKAFRNLSGSGKRTKFFIMFKFYIRFIVTGIVLYLLIVKVDINVVGLLTGLSVVVINIILTTLLELSKKNFILKTKEVN